MRAARCHCEARSAEAISAYEEIACHPANFDGEFAGTLAMLRSR